MPYQRFPADEGERKKQASAKEQFNKGRLVATIFDKEALKGFVRQCRAAAYAPSSHLLVQLVQVPEQRKRRQAPRSAVKHSWNSGPGG